MRCHVRYRIRHLIRHSIRHRMRRYSVYSAGRPAAALADAAAKRQRFKVAAPLRLDSRTRSQRISTASESMTETFLGNDLSSSALKEGLCRTSSINTLIGCAFNPTLLAYSFIICSLGWLYQRLLVALKEAPARPSSN
jgi:hypothetical protein